MSFGRSFPESMSVTKGRVVMGNGYPFFYHHKNITREVINITIYHSQRERTQGSRAPIANRTHN